jgi:hypothetical protein
MTAMTDSWAFGPPKKVRRRGMIRRSRLLGAVLGFVMAASAVGVAAWLVMPNSPGFGYGRGAPAETGLVLVSIELMNGDLTTQNEFGPGDSGQLRTRWSNPNTFGVTLTRVSVPAGSTLVAVGDPTCTTTAFTATAETGGIPLQANNANTGEISLQFSAGATFPGCLAGVRFKVPVLGEATPA